MATMGKCVSETVVTDVSIDVKHRGPRKAVVVPVCVRTTVSGPLSILDNTNGLGATRAILSVFAAFPSSWTIAWQIKHVSCKVR